MGAEDQDGSPSDPMSLPVSVPARGTGSRSLSEKATPRTATLKNGLPELALYSTIEITLSTGEQRAMCRNIKMLFNFDPPVTDEEIRAALESVFGAYREPVFF